MLYEIADIFFLVFHTCIILFNLFGWIRKHTRKLNLVLLVLTGLSWGLLGIWYGFGYCPCTDWHWDILGKLGKTPQTPSYIEYLTERLTGINVSLDLANNATLIIFILLLLISSIMNWRDYKNIEVV